MIAETSDVDKTRDVESADMPFGGYKHSGIGREMGLAGFEEYLKIKAIATAAN